MKVGSNPGQGLHPDQAAKENHMVLMMIRKAEVEAEVEAKVISVFKSKFTGYPIKLKRNSQ